MGISNYFIFIRIDAFMQMISRLANRMHIHILFLLLYW